MADLGPEIANSSAAKIIETSKNSEQPVKGRILPKLCLVKLHFSREVSKAMMKLVRNKSEPQGTSLFGRKVLFWFHWVHSIPTDYDMSSALKY